MPEWTGESRNSFYRAVAAGDLEEVRRLIAPYLTLRQSDLKPVDSAALEQFQHRLQGDPALQETLAGMLLDAHSSVRLTMLFLLEKLGQFPGSVLLKVWHRFAADLDERLRQRHRQEIVDHWDILHQKFERRGVTLEQIKTDDSLLTPFYRYVSKEDQAWLEALIAAACICPSPEAAEIFSLIRGGLDAYLTAKSKARIVQTRETLEKRALAEATPVPMDAPQATEPPSRERLLGMMARGDLDGIERLATGSPKLTPARRRALCENLPQEVTEILTRDMERLGRVFDWMEDAGLLGQIASEWVNQGEWPQLGILLATWIKETAQATRTWDVPNKMRRALKSYTKPPRLTRHLEALAVHLSPELICSLIHTFAYHLNQPYSIRQYVQQELAISLLRRLGVEAARERLASIASPPPGCDDFGLQGYPGYIRMLNSYLEREYHCSDPLRRHGHLDHAPVDSANGPKTQTEATPLSEEEVAAIAAGLQSPDADEIDRAFARLMRHSAQIAQAGYKLAELTALGLWQVKSSEAKKSLFRLQALVARAVCSPKEAAALVEQAFAIEDPTLWRSAAKTIRDFRKQDPSIRLSSPERVQEILARDPEKHGKYLAPILS